ncbi:hypothetical protein FRC20_011606 [Serendipita sp. 405]|nr:hypothetical protein FRC16_011151 [Serendipita sp. 398]KAG8860487.1 hypothetical protein FRC20_011606 [Serendipita sp. 405]
MGFVRPTRQLRTFPTSISHSRHFSSRFGGLTARSRVRVGHVTVNLPNGQRRSISDNAEGAMPDYYKILDLPRESTAAQIKTQYYQLAKKHHPDVAGAKYDNKIYGDIQEAYETLGSPHKRRNYDSKLFTTKGVRVDAGNKPRAPGYYESRYTRTGPSLRAQRRKEAMQQGTWTANRHSADRGFAPRSSWDPQFRLFFDDWVTKMGEKGMNKEELESERNGHGPSPRVLEQLMDADMLRAYMKKRRAEGKDPLDGVFKDEAGRNSKAGQWLKNRMAMIDRESEAQAGGTWARGGSKRADSSNFGRGFAANWGRGPARRSANTVEEGSPAGRLGGYGTGEETFNSPWDDVPRRGFQRDVPRPWWTVRGSQGESHTSDAWSPDPSLSGTWGKRGPGHPSMLYTAYSSATLDGNSPPRPIKRDYTKGHQLDPRFEDDRRKMVAIEKRWKAGAAAVALAFVLLSGSKAFIG